MCALDLAFSQIISFHAHDQLAKSFITSCESTCILISGHFSFHTRQMHHSKLCSLERLPLGTVSEVTPECGSSTRQPTITPQTVSVTNQLVLGISLTVGPYIQVNSKWGTGKSTRMAWEPEVSAHDCPSSPVWLQFWMHPFCLCDYCAPVYL